jgi:hypothetical protein
VNVLDQMEGDRWIAYQGDCVEVVRGLPDESIHYSVFSPPFASLYTYSASPRDMGNSTDGLDFSTSRSTSATSPRTCSGSRSRAGFSRSIAC